MSLILMGENTFMHYLSGSLGKALPAFVNFLYSMYVPVALAIQRGLRVLCMLLCT
jgi:hypothetical protein